eukprot:TRINITY_DN3416_c0_g1::TRINITY_DN3416_c0_g1_i1::g.20627::m.20627 TRINITY_DN3416_c0_g1::TRINITY_DN3416_c0_g1_i1::g.20627  ORF type:complete len:130 (+),score=7.84,sp/Q55FI7/ZSWM7_DICDI/34.26/1e-12,SWIM/PF04434.12/0.00029 TRINITY_DN3416_c0_g1_i1:133-522(+)
MEASSFGSPILDAVMSRIQKNQNIQEDDLSILYSIYHHTLESALECLETGGVTKVVAPCGRQTFIVQGRKPYQVFPHYCSCPAFSMFVLTRNEILNCKHQLAMKLAIALDRVKVQNVTDVQFSDYLTAT